MKKIIIPIVLALTSAMANAEYMIKIPLEQNQGGTLPNGSVSFAGKWIDTSTVYGEWLDQGYPYNCISWSPAASTITIGETFTQTATDCSQDQIRTAQDREVETISGIIRDKGEPYTQSRAITVSSTRDSVGTLETWVATTPNYTDWVNSGEIYGCTNWSPATSTVNQGVAFTQTATDCDQDQTRSRQEREQETTTLAIRNNGASVTETQTITVSSTRPATGTKVLKDCRYQYSVGNTTHWAAQWSGSGGWEWYHVIWDKNIVVNHQVKVAPSNWSYTKSGYKYTLGRFIKKETYSDDDGTYTDDIYEICREPI